MGEARGKVMRIRTAGYRDLRLKAAGLLPAQVGYRPTRQVISEAAIVTLVDLDLSAQQIDGWHRSLRDFSR